MTNHEIEVDGKSTDEAADDIERRMVEDALKKYHWNKQKAAQELGRSRQGLGKKMRRLVALDPASNSRNYFRLRLAVRAAGLFAD